MRYLIEVNPIDENNARMVLMDGYVELTSIDFTPTDIWSFDNAHRQLMAENPIAKEAGVSQGLGTIFIEGATYGYALQVQFNKRLQRLSKKVI